MFFDYCIEAGEVSYQDINSSKTKHKVEISGLPKGYGMTLGNMFRRVMLSSLPGVAVTAVKINGVLHEFTSVPGVKEDVADIILNIKSLFFTCDYENVSREELSEGRIMKLYAVGPCNVTASMLSEDSVVSVVNGDAVICNLDAGCEFEMELVVSYGSGYMSKPTQQTGDFTGASAGVSAYGSIDNNDIDVNLIDVNAVFSPVKKVFFEVDNVRKGQRADYERLTFHIDSNGSVPVKRIFELTSKLIQDQLSIFMDFEAKSLETTNASSSSDSANSLTSLLLRRVSEFELSVRSHNCLRHCDIRFVGDLVQKTECKLMRMPNFGRKSLTEIKCLLKNMDLSLGMTVENWGDIVANHMNTGGSTTEESNTDYDQ